MNFYKQKKGFSLIELLVVIGILLILAGGITSGVNLAKEHAAKTKARAMIYSLSLALRAYELDWGIFPPDPAGGTNRTMVNSLLSDKRNGPYLEIKDKDTDATGDLIDPWKNRYVYENNTDGDGIAGGPHNDTTYDIYSFGPDMNDDLGIYDPSNNKDDINNWD